VIAGFP